MPTNPPRSRLTRVMRNYRLKRKRVNKLASRQRIYNTHHRHTRGRQ